MNVLALSSASPDHVFTTLSELARWIVTERARVAPVAELTVLPSILGRDALPDGACLTVRALDGSGPKGRGRLIGFAFLETPDLGHGAMPDMAGRLMTAIVVAQAAHQANAVRPQLETANA